MKKFFSVHDTNDPTGLAREAVALKQNPQDAKMGEGKTLGLIFFNASLRTRMSTTKAAYNLGMHVITMNISSDSWQLELNDGAVMDEGKAEHIKEAAAVMGSYCDILGIRSFPTLSDRELDYKDEAINAFYRYSGVPVISLESSTLHPLQSLADLMTILEYSASESPKIVLTWAPHVNALPQSVPNSFAEWMLRSSLDLTIVQPKGWELADQYTNGAQISYDQNEALSHADFVYVKNWSSYHSYGQIHHDQSWQINMDKLALTNNGRLMHCLPVRRNVVISDDALDSEHSIVLPQAHNRVFAAQIVLIKMLESL